MDAEKIASHQHRLDRAKVLSAWIANAEKALKHSDCQNGLVRLSCYDSHSRFVGLLASNAASEETAWPACEADQVERNLLQDMADSILRRRLDRAKKMLADLNFED